MDRIKKIKPVNQEYIRLAEERWDNVAKPLKSLGLLEEAIAKIAGIQETADIDISRRTVAVMCADNGVIKENITQSDSSVTSVCAKAIAEGTSNVNLIAKTCNAEVIAVDVGIKNPPVCERLINRHIADGTMSIADGPAMTTKQAEEAIKVGIDTAQNLKSSGTKIIITGEMGIGNTTTASAVTAALLGVEADLVTGRGAGLDSVRLAHKIEVVRKALEINKPDKSKPIELIAKIGGYDIAAMTGLYLGGAVYGLPVVIDGVISAAAAALAAAISHEVKDYMLASHVSAEPAGKMLLESIGLKPVITAEMRLGEGTGGVMLLPLLDCALSVYNSAHTFKNINVDKYRRLK